MPGRHTTLYVSGLSTSTRARDVAKEFERFGQLVRCDIPTPSGRSRGYAFVEFQDERDAEVAFDRTRGLRIDGHDVRIEWARREPAAGWDQVRRKSPPRGRSPSPRRERSPPRDRERERDRDRARERDRPRSPRRDEPRREETRREETRRDEPRREERRRSPSPRRDDRK